MHDTLFTYCACQDGGRPAGRRSAGGGPGGRVGPAAFRGASIEEAAGSSEAEGGGSGAESLAIQGFSHALQSTVPRESFKEELRVDLAGNMFCAYVLLPLNFGIVIHAPVAKAILLVTKPELAQDHGVVTVDSQGPDLVIQNVDAENVDAKAAKDVNARASADSM